MSDELDNLNYPLFSLDLKLANLKIVSVVRVKLKLFQKRKENIIINCYISISELIGKFKSIS